jgi:hypothetical protein
MHVLKLKQNSFGHKKIGAKAAHQMLVKLTAGFYLHQ